MFTLRILILPGVVCWGCTSTVEFSGRSAPISLSAPIAETESLPSRGRGVLPAHLTILSKGFDEPSGNRALDAEEDGALVISIGNDGLGPAKVGVRLTALTDVENLEFRRHTDIGHIAVGDTLQVRIPFRAGEDVASGRRELRVEVLEEYNRAVLPFTFAFDTRRLAAPEFRIIVRDSDDGRFFAGNTPDGLVQAGEMVQVVANVQNVGGLAEAVEVQVEVKGEGVSYTRNLKGVPDNRFILGELAPGESRDVEFYFFTTPVYAGSAVEIGLHVSEARGRFGAEETLAFDIGGSVRTEEVLAVQAVQAQAQPVALVQTALVDIEEVPQHSKTRLDNGIAIIFGIEEYRHASAATYKSRDAAYFYRYCREVLRIPEERILLRTDSDATKAEFDYVFEPKATPNQGWLKMRLRSAEEAAQTDVLVYLAGHGFPDLATGRPYLIPHDVRPEQATNGVALERLYQTLSAFGARSVTVFVESCFSGASGYDRDGEEQLLALHMNPVFPVMEQPMIGPETVVFSATSGKRPSSNRDDLKHGIFTYFVLKGLGGAADLDGDAAVTVAELFRYVEEEVPRKALEPPLDREQVPEILPSVSRLRDRGDRVLVRY